MQPFNSATGPSICTRNGTTSSLDKIHTLWNSGLPTTWGSGPDVSGLDQRLWGDLTSSHEFTQVIPHQCYTDFPTRDHSITENSLPFHSKTADNEQFCYPFEPQDFILSAADDSITQSYVLSHAVLPWFDSGELPQPLPAVTLQPSTEPLPVMASPQASSQSPSICEWIENDVQCGQAISSKTLGAHLHNAHKVQGNEKKKLACRWRDCDQELQRGGMKRHVATRHLKTKSHCHYCLKPYSRQDAMKKHARQCQVA